MSACPYALAMLSYGTITKVVVSTLLLYLSFAHQLQSTTPAIQCEALSYYAPNHFLRRHDRLYAVQRAASNCSLITVTELAATE